MKNAFSRMGRTCASMMIGGGLVAVGLFAAPVGKIDVTLTHAINVNGNTLPSGQYTITALDIAGGDDYFVIRSANTAPVTVQTRRVSAEDDTKTEVVFSKEGDTWRLDKMFVQGETNGYEFINAK